MDETVPTICVVGSGAAGLAAALAAAEAARAQSLACRIVLIDRARQGEHGGNTRFSPSYMRMAAPDRVAPGFEDDLAEVSGGRMDAAYIRRLAADAPATMAWLMGHGIAFDQPVYYLSAGPPRIQPVGGGAAVLRALERAARDAGVVTRYDCTAERLLVGRNGAVRASRCAPRPARWRRIEARAVVLASGGFAGNGEMLAQHLGPGADSLAPISPGTRFNTGDGIRMALAAGAQAAGDWRGMHAEPVDPRSRNSAPVVLVYPYGIVVDCYGQALLRRGRRPRARDVGGLRAHHPLRDARAHRLRDPGCEALRHRRLPARDPLRGAAASGEHDPGAGCADRRSRRRRFRRPSRATTRRRPAIRHASTPTHADGLAADASLSPPKSNWCRPLDRPPYLAYPLIHSLLTSALATEIELVPAARPPPILPIR